MKVICHHCGSEVEKPTGQINRARKQGNNIYCNRECAGLAKRKNLTDAEKKEKKRLYDMEYRAKNKEVIKKKKAEYFQRTYDPVEAAKYRKKRMHIHVERCRKPEYRAYKKQYDRVYRAKKDYGDLWEVQLAILSLQDEIDSRADRYQIYSEKETLNKKQQRTRHEQRLNREESERRPMGYAERC